MTDQWAKLLRLEAQVLEREIDRHLASTGEFPDFAWSSVTVEGQEWVIRAGCGSEPPEGAGKIPRTIGKIGEPKIHALYDLRAFKARTIDET